MFSETLLTEARRTLEALRSRRLTCATAESCTGGLVGALLTAIPGSSDVVDRGFITYSNRAKIEMLGVSEATLHDHGAVSMVCAEAMARGALQRSAADRAVAITGVAGPGGGTERKPVGLVVFAVADGLAVRTFERRYGNLTRDEIRHHSVVEALNLLRDGP